jgi:hypothetical protein
LLCDEIAIQRATRPLDLAEALFRIRCQLERIIRCLV